MSKHKPNLRVFKPKKRVAITGQHELLVDSMGSDGRGIAKHKGKTVFVSGALPDELASVRFVSSRKNYDEAEVVKIIKPSASRVEPSCEYFGQCGGCNLQHYDYSQQVAFKQHYLETLFSNLDKKQSTCIQWADAVIDDSHYYRHRIRMAIYAKGKVFTMGYRAANSHEVIPIAQCAIADKQINAILPALKSTLSGLQKRSLLDECSISVDAEQLIAITLRVKSALPEEDQQTLIQFANGLNVFLQIFEAAQMYGLPLMEVNARTQQYALDDTLTIAHQPSDFTQVNTAINQKMIAQMLQWLSIGGSDVLADFFCGIGNLTLPIALQADRVQAFELVSVMVEKAKANADVHKVTNINYSVQDLFTASVNIDKSINKAVLDPPRAGAKQLCELLPSQALTHVLYISCNPSTLFRDAEILQQAGYTITKASLIDMFPQTKHMECMMLFERPPSFSAS